MSELLPIFVNLAGRRVLLVGGGPVAASKLASLLAAGSLVTVVAPDVHADIEQAVGRSVVIERRPFAPADLDGVWLVVAAATPAVNRAVADAAEQRSVFVNAVDDPGNASAFLSGVVRRDGVTIGISTSGDAPGLTALMREALDALLPRDLAEWMDESAKQRAVWKERRVPMAERRPLLLQALNRLYEARPSARADHAAEAGEEPKTGRDRSGADAMGHVSIVGAGPGDPGLLTRAAVSRLRQADLVLYDALIDERILRIARRSQRFFVGKRSGRHVLTQTAIHEVMIRAARRGRRVVRLKGGDPFVFGRGGEEALALAQAGVPFDIVPGITSAVAGPALAGIPVTHRGLSSAFFVVSGHDEQAFAASVADVTPSGVTLVVLMGLARRAGLAAILIERGWDPRTPAALITRASTSEQDVWRGSLAELAGGLSHSSSEGPALFVVGAVAALTAIAGGLGRAGVSRDAGSSANGTDS